VGAREHAVKISRERYALRQEILKPGFLSASQLAALAAGQTSHGKSGQMSG
jgi:hypothetical protein